MIDYIAGLEKDVSYNLRSYKTFPPSMCRILTDYLREGGRLFVTGAYIGSDMQQVEERDFTEKVLKYRYAGSARSDSTDFVRGLNLQFPIFRSPSSLHYAVSDPNILMPAGSGAFSVLPMEEEPVPEWHIAEKIIVWLQPVFLLSVFGMHRSVQKRWRPLSVF